jgi:hypothetical protein
MKKSIALIITLSLLSSIANASYVLRIPTEVSTGGSLPNGSINFVSNAGTPTDVPDNTPDAPAEVPTEPLNPMQVCDAKRVSVEQLIAKNYPDTSLKYAGIGSYMGVEGCVMEMAIPKSKSYECTGNFNYEDQVSAAFKALDYTVTSYEHQGTCS